MPTTDTTRTSSKSTPVTTRSSLPATTTRALDRFSGSSTELALNLFDESLGGFEARTREIVIDRVRVLVRGADQSGA